MVKIYFQVKFKELRLEKQLWQVQVAKEFDTTQSTIAKWEKGILQPDLLTLAKIAKFFGVSTDYLLGLED